MLNASSWSSEMRAFTGLDYGSIPSSIVLALHYNTSSIVLALYANTSSIVLALYANTSFLVKLPWMMLSFPHIRHGIFLYNGSQDTGSW